MQRGSSNSDQTYVCLRQDLLRPGDVLLVRNTGLEARGISLAHPSRFSHAALFVDRSRLFEADGFGVGATRPAVCTLQGGGGPLVLLPDTRGAAVLRHPALADLEPGSTSEADLSMMLEAIVARKVQPYSRLARLSRAAGPLEPLASVVLEAMDFHEAVHQPRASARRKHDQGRFCSEIVCEVLEELGYPVFQDGRPHAGVGPGHLTEAGLVEVTEAVVERDAAQLAQPPEHLELLVGEYQEARAMLALEVEQRLSARRAEESAAEGPGGRIDALRERVDLYRQVLDELQRNYRALRLERHALAAERLSGTLTALRSDRRRGALRAAREVARLSAEYELLRVRAAANALRRVGDALGYERLEAQAARLERRLGGQ